jgi:Cu+-exporting ATPase
MAQSRMEFPIIGMTCANCAAAVERTLLRKIPGIRLAVVNLATERATVEFDPEEATPEMMQEAVDRAGYRLLLSYEGEDGLETERQARAEEIRRQRRAFIVGLAFTLPLFAFSMARDFSLLGSWAHAPWTNGMLLVLATPVQFYAGGAYYVGAWKSLRNHAANMDVLVALGSSTAYFYSLAVLVAPGLGGHVFFETSAMIITLIRLGKMLEAKAKGRASQAVESLLAMTPRTARLVDIDGEEQEIPAAALRVGDVVAVRPGEAVPADGEVTHGASSVDESSMTGESMPVDKKPKDEVFGGSLNLQGVLTVRIAAVGAQTAIAHIVRLVREAQGTKAPIQRLADRVSSVFVPAIILVAGVTFAAWWTLEGDAVHAMVRTVAVLVIACPCALGLATPTAIMAGTGRGAMQGVLFRSSIALETAHRIEVVLLDKTGTLTQGRPVLTDWVPLGGEDVLALAAGAESSSSHPVALALMAKAAQEGVRPAKVEQFTQVAGFGVEAVLDRRRIRVGTPSWGTENGDLSSEAAKRVDTLASEGKTVAVVAVDGKPRALFAVADSLKTGALAAVEGLRDLGVEPVLLTGDNEEAAQAVARIVGIERVLARVLPHEKEAAVRQEQQKGRLVAMVGDGVNDAPALARADVGMAIGTGTDVAVAAADVTLVSGDPQGVVRAIRLSRATMRVIRQNLFWAFVYNIALVPLAAGAFASFSWMPRALADLHPAFAAGAMAASSITVVLNSLRLARVTPTR